MANLPDVKQSTNWQRLTWIVVLGLTAARILALALNQTGLYLDEEQYWLWGQNLDFGYFSKPPLIGWLIGGVTALAGSDSVFWVRFPGPLLHGVTALLLARWAHEALVEPSEHPAQTGFWVALAYVTLPIATVGSFVIATDSVMAPFLAVALLTYWRMLDRPGLRLAILTGLLVGIAMMAKYAAIYVFLFAAIAAVFVPRFRIQPRHAVAIVLATVLVILPNLIWNLTHDLATLTHTAGNAGWLSEDKAARFTPLSILGFLAAQSVVMGPILFCTVLLIYLRPVRSGQLALIAFSLPVFVLVGGQSVVSDVNANWTFSACLAATPMAVIWLLQRNARRTLWAAIGLNCVLVIALPLATMAPHRIVVDDKPLLARYLGRADMAAQILDAARVSGATAILTGNRAFLADLFYEGRDSQIPVYSTSATDKVLHYYAQTYPLPDTVDGPVLYVSRKEFAPNCDATVVAQLNTVGGAYEKRPPPSAYLLDPTCLEQVRYRE